MITVDCGISGIEDIDYANNLGLTTIVTTRNLTKRISSNRPKNRK